MKWGIERADKESMPCYVNSMPERPGFYQRHGFAEVSQVDIDVAEYRGQFCGYGIWRMYGMLRDARTTNA